MGFSRQEYFYYNKKEKATTLWFLPLPIWWFGFHIVSFNHFFVILLAIMLTSLEKILVRDQFCRKHLGTIPILSAYFHNLWLIPVGAHHQQIKLFTWNQILNLWILILSKGIENISGFSKNDVTTRTLYFYMFLNRKKIPAMFENLAINHAGPHEVGHSHSLCHRGWLVNKPDIFHPFQGTKRRTELSVLYLAGSQLLHRNIYFPYQIS